MSTERERSGLRSYRRSLVAVFTCLVLLAGTLAAFGMTQAPRLTTVEGNPTTLTERTGGRILLHTNQPVDTVAPDAVRITPDLPFEVSSEATVITLTFPDMLRYGATYDIAIRVAGQFTGAHGELTYSLRTPETVDHALVRSADQDRIVRQRLGSGDDYATVYEAPRIHSYALLRDRMAVVTLDDSGGAEPSLISPGDATRIPLSATAYERVRDLQAEPFTGLIGYVAHGHTPGGDRFDDLLVIHDTNQTVTVAHPMTDSDGSPYAVREWAFLPASTSVVILTAANDLIVVNALLDSRTAIPVDVTALLGFLPGTSRLVAAASEGDVVIDLTDPEGTPVPLGLSSGPRPDPPADEQIDDEILAALPDITVRTYARDSVVFTRANSGTSVVRSEDGRETARFEPASATSRIGDMCLSPNGELLAVEVISAEGRADGYPGSPGFSNTMIVYLDTETNQTIHQATGMQSGWCD